MVVNIDEIYKTFTSCSERDREVLFIQMQELSINRILLAAVKEGDAQTVKWLARRASPTVIGLSDQHGRTALHWAMQYCYYDIAENLMNHMTREDINKEDNLTLRAVHLCQNSNLVSIIRNNVVGLDDTVKDNSKRFKFR